MEPVVPVQLVAPDSKPPLAIFWPEQPPVVPTVQLNDAVPEWLALSVAVTVTFEVPAVVAVPEIVPVEELIDRPAGRPEADQVYGAVPPEADSGRFTEAPVTVDWLPGLDTVTVPVAEQVGSADWAGTLIASHAALTVLNSVQLPGNRFFAAVSVQVRYFRYELLEVLSSIAL